MTKRRQYIFSLSLKFQAYYITVIKMLLNEFFIFHDKICAFIIFIFFFFFLFFKEVSNFCNRIITNHKRELMVSDCQWNCMPGRYPKEHKIATFKAMTLEKLTRRTNKSIHNFLLLNQFSRPSSICNVTL